MPRTLRSAALLLALSLPAAGQTVTLYEHIDFAGKSVTVSAANAALASNWNDRASSLEVEGGTWELCRHNQFADCRQFDRDVADLRAAGFNDAISSLRPVAAPIPSFPGAGAGPEAGTAGAPAGSAPSAAPAPAAVGAGAAAHAGEAAEVRAYLDYRKGPDLIVDGQRLVIGPSTKFHGSGEARSPASIPLGYQVEASGTRRADGAIAVARLDAKPNGQQMFESDVKQATDQLEATWRAGGEMLTAAPNGGTQSLGKMHESGPEYERARRLVDRVLPPYLQPSAVRVYVVDNPEWNAMAMGNYSIYVFTGIMGDLDDDELALVIGHEIVHASHEHTRKQQKRGILTGLAAISAQVIANEALDGNEATAAGILAGLGAVAFANGYSRDQEDQADRVGLRYAYEAGYDVRKGPRLWKRFAEKYGEPGKAQNILFGDHSRSGVRAAALEREIALNYP